MKIIRRKTETFEFDLDEEMERLHSCFKGKQLQRQLDIINAMFVNYRWARPSGFSLKT